MNQKYDVFLSYNRRDHPAVEAVARALRERDLTIFLDRWYLMPGRPWQPALEEALGDCRAVAVFLGPHGMGRWQQREKELALERQASDPAFPVIPVLLPDVDDPALGFLRLNTWVDLRARLDDPLMLAMLTAAVRREPPGPDLRKRVAATLAAVCPYRGLRPFREEDATLFFGRETVTARLVEAVDKHTLVAVVGASGSGKSSVVRAGLVPYLRRRIGERVWDVATLVPGDRPLHALAAALIPLLEPEMTEIDWLAEVSKLASHLAEGRVALRDVVVRALEKQPGTDRLLLVADQWEDLYTLGQEGQVLHRFLDELLKTTVVGPLTVVFTLRGDFFGHALGYRPFVDRLQDAVINLGPMTQEELARAVEEPAQKVGLIFEPGLVERILNDVGEEPGNLPLLEFALTELWTRRQSARLTHATYQDVGKVAGAIAQRAETVFRSFTPKQQTTARHVFTRLVRVAQPEERTEDTRQCVNLDDLDEMARPVVKVLADARLLVTGRYETTNEEIVEVAHEALIRAWTRLRDWLNEDREFLLWRRRLQAALVEWERTRRDESTLLPEASLPEAERWLAEQPDDLSQDERNFIQESVALRERKAAEREAQRQRELDAAQKVAEAERRRAEEQARAATRLRWLAIALTAVFLLAVWAALFARGQQQQAQTEADAHATEVVVRSTAEAKAKENERLVATRAAEAIAARETAEARRMETERLSLVSVAQALAVYASHQQTHQQDERGALLARQAYLFNRRSQGSALDQIDEALRTVLGVPHFRSALNSYEAGVSAVAFSPRGQMLASGSLDGTVRLWNLHQRGATPIVLYGHEGAVGSVVFSPDGKTLASGSADGTVRLWGLRQSRVTSTVLQDHESAVNSVAFSPDGKTLASGSADGTVWLWHLNEHSPTSTALPDHDFGVRSVAFSPNGKMLASATEDGTIHLWGVDQPSSTPTILRGHGSGVRSVVFSPDGRTLASGSVDGTVRLWDPRQPGVAPVVLRDHQSVVNSVAFSPDGKMLASGSTDGIVRLWHMDRHNPAPTALLHGHARAVLSVAFSPDGKMLASASEDMTIQLWDMNQPSAEPIMLHGHQWKISSVAFASDGQMLASGSIDHTIRLWDISQPSAEPTVLRSHDFGVRSVAFSPNGQMLASGGNDGTVRLWDVSQPNPTPIADLRGHDFGVRSVAFSPDGQMLASGGDDGIVRLWGLEQPGTAPIATHDHKYPVLSVTFSPDGEMLASAGLDGTVKLWDVNHPSTTPIVLRGHEGWARSVAFGPDGQMLASGGDDKTVRLWDVSQPNPTPTILHGHESVVNSVAFSPDGQMLASGGGDHTVRLWNVHQLNASPIVLRGHKSGVLSVAFSPDGETLASGSDDGTIFLWITRTEALAELVCEKVWRNLTTEEWRLFVGEGIPYERTCPELPPGDSPAITD